VKFINLTRDNEIGANSYLLDFDGDGRVLLDAGMHPRQDGEEALPNVKPLLDRSLDAILVSHAHHDHIGALPLILRHRPEARTFVTEATAHLAEALLHNSVEVMLKQRAARNILAYPLYTHREVDDCLQRLEICQPEREWSLDGGPSPRGESLSFRYHHAGHVLGAVGIEVFHRGRSIFYTGDVNFREQTVTPRAAFQLKSVDVLIVETTRGSQPMPDGTTRETELQRLAESIERTFHRGGSVLIPVFALGKTQELLGALYFLQKQGKIRRCPIFISGLGKSFSLVYDRLARRSFRLHPQLRLLADVEPQVLDPRKPVDLRAKKPRIYLISSGMMTEKTPSNLLARKFLPHEEHSIYFVGYADPDSPAGRLLSTERGSKVVLDEEVGEETVRCEVDRFDLTAHAQREDLLDFILRADPRVCVLVHGDPPSLDWFRQELARLRPAMKVMVPPPGEPIEL
jgi:Cft2 family RNA processing exonuclease